MRTAILSYALAFCTPYVCLEFFIFHEYFYRIFLHACINIFQHTTIDGYKPRWWKCINTGKKLLGSSFSWKSGCDRSFIRCEKQPQRTHTKTTDIHLKSMYPRHIHKIHRMPMMREEWIFPPIPAQSTISIQVISMENSFFLSFTWEHGYFPWE